MYPVKIKGKIVYVPEEAGFDEIALTAENLCTGQIPIYILESPEDQCFFFSKSPIDINDLREHFSEDEFLLGREPTQLEEDA